LVNYKDNGLDFSDIVAYSGVAATAMFSPGMSGSSEAFLHIFPMELMVFNIASNLNASTVAGVEKNGTYALNIFSSKRGISSSLLPNIKLENRATGTVYFNSGDEAFDYLKRVIAADYPVVVVLDAYYLDYRIEKGQTHQGVWASVSGYDKTYVYINDPTHATKRDNQAATVDNFILAWGKTRELLEDQIGPYWMFYLSQIGIKKSPAEVIALNVMAAKGTPANIRNFITRLNNSSGTLKGLHVLAITRLAFATFLDKNGMNEAAALYRESGNLLASLSEGSGIMSRDLNIIADREEQALRLLSK
jgi:hypothetical protein